MSFKIFPITNTNTFGLYLDNVLLGKIIYGTEPYYKACFWGFLDN